VKRLVVIAFVLLFGAAAVIELGSPYWTRNHVSSAASAAASAGARSLASTKDSKLAQAAAAKAATDGGAHLESFTQQPNGTVKVTVSEEAKSYLLHRWSATRDWYQIKASASAAAG
jgi:Flp pilus assembly protein TadG